MRWENVLWFKHVGLAALRVTCEAKFYSQAPIPIAICDPCRPTHYTIVLKIHSLTNSLNRNEIPSKQWIIRLTWMTTSQVGPWGTTYDGPMTYVGRHLLLARPAQIGVAPCGTLSLPPGTASHIIARSRHSQEVSNIYKYPIFVTSVPCTCTIYKCIILNIDPQSCELLLLTILSSQICVISAL